MSTTPLRVEKAKRLDAAPANSPVMAPAIEPEVSNVLKLVQGNPAALTPKEVAGHVARLMESYDALTARFAENSQRIEAELASLRKDSGALSGQVQQLGTELKQHGGSLESLTSDTQADVDRLNTGVSALNTLIDVQDSILSEQSTRLDQFDAALELLDTATRGNRARIEAVREDVEKKHAVVRTQINGLEALQRDHHAELVQVRQQVQVLQLQARHLDANIQSVSGTLATHIGTTRKSFRIAAASAASLLVISLGGFALVKWSPSLMPVPVQAALAQTGQRIDALTQQIAGLPGLESRSQVQEKQVAQLTQTVATLQKSVISLRKSVATLRNETSGAIALPSLQDGVWLLQQEPARYTVQLLGVPGIEEMNAVLAENAVSLKDASLAHTVTRRNGQDRHNLFYGVYDSAADAKQAIAKLPAELQTQKPWVRTLRSVQATLK